MQLNFMLINWIKFGEPNMGGSGFWMDPENLLLDIYVLSLVNKPPLKKINNHCHR